jgi:hypothetical protein
MTQTATSSSSYVLLLLLLLLLILILLLLRLLILIPLLFVFREDVSCAAMWLFLLSRLRTQVARSGHLGHDVVQQVARGPKVEFRNGTSARERHDAYVSVSIRRLTRGRCSLILPIARCSVGQARLPTRTRICPPSFPAANQRCPLVTASVSRR